MGKYNKVGLEGAKNGRAKRKYECPSCGKKNTFTRFIDEVTGQYIADDVGRCDRENSCGYIKTPKDYYDEKKGLYSTMGSKIIKEKQINNKKEKKNDTRRDIEFKK